jgi:hypothetical protein
LDLPQSTGQSIPIYAPAEIVPCNGALPRLLARTGSVEVTLPKFKRNYASADGSEAALPGGRRAGPMGGHAMALTAAFRAPRIALPTQSFQARAPPPATA